MSSRLKWYEHETHEKRMEALDGESISFAFSIVMAIVFLVGVIILVHRLFS